MEKRHLSRMLCMVLIAALLFTSVDIRSYAEESADSAYDLLQSQDVTERKSNAQTEDVTQQLYMAEEKPDAQKEDLTQDEVSIQADAASEIDSVILYDKEHNADLLTDNDKILIGDYQEELLVNAQDDSLNAYEILNQNVCSAEFDNMTFDEVREFYYRQLSGNEIIVYQKLRDKEAAVDSISINQSEIKGELLQTEVNRAYTAYITDNPDFRLKYDRYCHDFTYDDLTSEYTIELVKEEYYSDYKGNKINAKKEQIKKAISSDDYYLMIAKLWNYTWKNTEYQDSFFISESKSYYYSNSAMGYLISGYSVCAGYADLCKIICNEMEIPCIIVGNGGHAWNYIEMENGKWYAIDLVYPGCEDCDLNVTYGNMLVGSSNERYLSDQNYFITELYINNMGDFVFPILSKDDFQYTGECNIDSEVTLPSSSFIDKEGEFIYKVNEDSESCTVIDYEGKESGDLIIPDMIDGYTVTNIGNAAFYHCIGFNGNLVLPNNLMRIGQMAFSGCKNLSGEIIFPNSMIEIGEGAFVYCEKISGDLNLPNGMERIGINAFSYCSSLTGDIVVPENITNLDWFYRVGCKGKLVLSKNSEYVEDFSYRCIWDTRFSEVEVPADAENYTVSGNILYSKDGTTLLYCPSGYSGKIEILEKCQRIADRAFYNCNKIELDRIPESIKYIGRFAFGEAGTITELRFSEDIEYGEGCFMDTDIETIIVDELELYQKAFYMYSIGSYDNFIYIGDLVEIGREAHGFYNIFPERIVITNKDATINSFYPLDDIFNKEKSTIYGYEGSTAEKFALENNIAFVVLQDTEEEILGDVSDWLYENVGRRIILECNGGYSRQCYQRVKNGENFGTTYRPIYSDNFFVGWYTDRVNGELIGENTIVDSNFPSVVYAHWTDNIQDLDPSEEPSAIPSASASAVPSEEPSAAPSVSASTVPSKEPSTAPTVSASAVPSEEPSIAPSESASAVPSIEPSESASAVPSEEPSAAPSVSASAVPSIEPSAAPSVSASAVPSEEPSKAPSASASAVPSAEPSKAPSASASSVPSTEPSTETSVAPSESASTVPSAEPSIAPSESASAVPSEIPSTAPSEIPSTAPSEEPSELPDILPSIAPEVDVTVSISMNDIENKEKEKLNKIAEEAVTQTVENSIPEGLDYNGGKQTVDLNLTIDGVQLAEGTDYVIKYKNAVNAGGEARMEIKFLGDYKKLGTVTKEFTINALDIAGDDFAAADLYYVAGKSVKPAPVLYYKGKKLKAGKDYTFDTIKIAEDTVLTLTGCGNFTGTRDINVIFIDKEEETRTSLSKAKIAISKKLVFEGSLVEPEGEDLVVSIGSGKNKVILERDVDYTVEFSGNDRPGTAVAVIRSLPGSEYCYGDKTVTFKIAGAKISKAKINLELTDKTGVTQIVGTKKGTEAAYTGSAICPSAKAAITNPDGSITTLREGIDYTLSYKKNRKKGTATVTVTGIGAYTGTKTVKFKIK